MTGLTKAIQIAGSASKLGRELGISRMAVCLWKQKGVPADRVLAIHSLTGVTPYELRPDIYPNPSDGLPQQQDNDIRV